MAGSQTLRFDVVGDASSAARAFRQTADGAALAARGARQLSDSLSLQSKTAQVSAAATVALAKSDDVLRDAELQLAASADEAGKQLGQQGRAAEDAAAKTRVAGEAAKGAGSGFGVLATPMGALVAAGVALSPVLVTVGFGMAGLGAAAAKTVAPILQAGTATKQAQQALAGLDPAQRAAYSSLTVLKGEFGSFSKSLEPEVLGIFNRGLDTASGLLHDVQPVAAATGKALGGVLGQVDAEFRSQTWQKFFGFMSATAGPDIQLLGKLFVDTADALPPLLEDLQPLATGLIQVADGAARTVGALAGLPADLSRAQQATNDYLSGIEKHIPSGNKNIFQVLGDGLGWLEKHIPAGSKSLLDLASGSDKAADAVKKTGTSAAQAAPQVGTLSGDVALLNTSATDAGTALSAYSDAWNKIVGNSLSDQQAVLADESAFSSLTTAVKNSGGQSLQARQAFVSYMQQVGTSISTLQQNGASVGAVNAEYEVNIRRLQGLHNLTPAQRSDIAGLIRDYDTWANSTAGLNKQTAAAAQTIAGQFTSGLKMAGDYTPKLNTDVNNLSNSILKTGTTSSATRGDRAALIADLEKAGIDADTATKMVDGLERKISGLKGKTVTVGVKGTGSGGVTIAGQNIPGAQVQQILLRGMASGGRVTAGTAPTADDVLVRVSRGETIVSAATSRKLAPVFAAHGVPGYAAGGLVGYPDAAASAASRDAQQAMLSDAVRAVAALKAKAAAAAAAAALAAAGPGGGTAAQNKALAKQLMPAWASGEQWASWDYLWTRESGWNQFAMNPSSRAYGIPQALPFTKMPKAAWPASAGGSSNVRAQESWGIGYIEGRYGSPYSAALHEQAYGWYGNGLDAVVSRPTLIGVGERGREHVQVTPMVPGGRGFGGDVHVHLHNDGVIGSQQQLEMWLNAGINKLARTGRLRYALQESPSARG